MSQCSFVCTQLDGFKYYYLTLIIILNEIEQFHLTHRWEPMAQSEPENNSNKRILYKTRASPSDKI